MTRIFLSLDTKCMSQEKLDKRIFGGAELFFLLLAKHLRGEGYEVEHWPNLPSGEYDMCIHSNEFNHEVKAKKHIIWSGSWTGLGAEHADKAIVLTKYMKSKMGPEWQNAFVIPAPYNSEIEKYKTEGFVPNRIVCTSNPNRHYLNMISLSHDLQRRRVDFHIELCGGNKLYSPDFPESHNFNMPKMNINYNGPLSRYEMFKLLESAQIWAYPGFGNWSETQGVAPVEAMALGIPTVLPKEEPFIEMSKNISPSPFIADTIEDFCDIVYDLLIEGVNHIDYDTSYYSEYRIMPMLLQLVSDTLRG